MWCMRSPSVLMCLFIPSLDSLGCPMLCGVLSCCLPAIVAILLIGFRDLYTYMILHDRLCGLVVRVLSYRSGGPGSIPGTTRKKK
jgi:hypothetical protein